MTGSPITGSTGSSAVIRAEFAAIATAFGLLPQMTGAANAAVVVNASGTALVTTGALSLAGAFTTTGAYSTTLVQRATTILTLPQVSGTLATLAGTEALTNKTINGITFAGGGGTTMTFPATTDTVVTLGTTQTLTNKTLTAPIMTAANLGTPANCVATNLTGTAAGLTAGIATTLVTSAVLPGSPTTTTQSPLDSSTKVATTAYVDSAVNVALHTARVTISSSQLLNLHTVPVQIIGAPGAGNAIQILSVFYELVFGTIAYTGGSGAGLYFSASISANNRVDLTSNPAALVNNTVSSILVNPLSNSTVPATSAVSNQAVNFGSSGTTFSTGDGTVVINVAYVVVVL